MRTDGLWLMEGAGNDFLVGVGFWADRLEGDPDIVARLCRRRRGVGADGVLAVTRSEEDRVVLRYRNADGSKARFCANGTRCAALAAVRLLGFPAELIVETDWVDIPARVEGERVRLELPVPGPGRRVSLKAGGAGWTGTLVEVGVPHLVIESEDDDSVFPRVAPILRRDPSLGPSGANVSFVRRDSGGRLFLRTFERGVEGETLCCGSAVVAVGALEMNARGQSRVEVRAASGDVLEIERIPGGFALTGPARFIAEIRPVSENRIS